MTPVSYKNKFELRVSLQKVRPMFYDTDYVYYT